MKYYRLLLKYNKIINIIGELFDDDTKTIVKYLNLDKNLKDFLRGMSLSEKRSIIEIIKMNRKMLLNVDFRKIVFKELSLEEIIGLLDVEVLDDELINELRSLAYKNINIIKKFPKEILRKIADSDLIYRLIKSKVVPIDELLDIISVENINETILNILVKDIHKNPSLLARLPVSIIRKINLKCEDIAHINHKAIGFLIIKCLEKESLEEIFAKFNLIDSYEKFNFFLVSLLLPEEMRDFASELFKMRTGDSQKAEFIKAKELPENILNGIKERVDEEYLVLLRIFRSDRRIKLNNLQYALNNRRVLELIVEKYLDNTIELDIDELRILIQKIGDDEILYKIGKKVIEDNIGLALEILPLSLILKIADDINALHKVLEKIDINAVIKESKNSEQLLNILLKNYVDGKIKLDDLQLHELILVAKRISSIYYERLALHLMERNEIKRAIDLYQLSEILKIITLYKRKDLIKKIIELGFKISELIEHYANVYTLLVEMYLDDEIALSDSDILKIIDISNNQKDSSSIGEILSKMYKERGKEKIKRLIKSLDTEIKREVLTYLAEILELDTLIEIGYSLEEILSNPSVVLRK